MKADAMLRLVRQAQDNLGKSDKEVREALSSLAAALVEQITTEAAKSVGKGSELAAARQLLRITKNQGRPPIAWAEGNNQWLTDFCFIAQLDSSLGLQQEHDYPDRAKLKSFLERAGQAKSESNRLAFGKKTAEGIAAAAKLARASKSAVTPHPVGNCKYDPTKLAHLLTLLGAEASAHEVPIGMGIALYLHSSRGHAMLMQMVER